MVTKSDPTLDHVHPTFLGPVSDNISKPRLVKMVDGPEERLARPNNYPSAMLLLHVGLGTQHYKDSHSPSLKSDRVWYEAISPSCWRESNRAESTEEVTLAKIPVELIMRDYAPSCDVPRWHTCMHFSSSLESLSAYTSIRGRLKAKMG